MGVKRGMKAFSGTTHELKCLPQHYEAVVDYRRSAEVRLNDRRYAVGDWINLREWCPMREEYTGRETIREITHILNGTTNGIDPDYVVMSIR